MSPSVQCEPHLAQLCAAPLHPIIRYHEQSPAPPSVFLTQEVVESEFTSWPPLLHTGHPQCPQPLLKGHVFQLCYQDCANTRSVFGGCCKDLVAGGRQESSRDKVVWMRLVW